jgi:hypothetical protein
MPHVSHLLLALVACVACDTLTRISTQPILDLQNMCYTDYAMWYRSTTNDTIRLSKASMHAIPTPTPLLPYKTQFIDTENSRVIIYAQFESATVPFYWVYGAQLIKPFYVLQNRTTDTLEDIYHVSANSTNYVITLLKEKNKTVYSLLCTCLETNVSVTIARSREEPSIYAHDSKFYIISNRDYQRVNSTVYFESYDPLTNTFITLDSYEVSLGTPHPKLRYAYGALFYQPSETNFRRYAITSNTSTDLVTNGTSLISISMARSISHPSQYIISDLDYTWTCQGAMDTCVFHPFYTYYQQLTYLPEEDKIAYIPSRTSNNKLLSFQVDTKRNDILYGNVRMDRTKTETSIVFMALQYHIKSNNILFIGHEFDVHGTYNVNLFKFDVQTELVTVITNLCYSDSGSCDATDKYLNIGIDGTVFVIKQVNETFHAFELKLEDPEVPTREPDENPTYVATIVVGSLFGVVIVAFVTFMGIIAIQRYRNALPKRVKYELVK